MWRSFLAARFNRFSSYRNYRWVILVAFWPKHGFRSNLRVPNFKAHMQRTAQMCERTGSHLRQIGRRSARTFILSPPTVKTSSYATGVCVCACVFDIMAQSLIRHYISSGMVQSYIIIQTKQYIHQSLCRLEHSSEARACYCL